MDKLLNGDCLDTMKTLDDNSVDMLLTDPPYALSNQSINQKLFNVINGSLDVVLPNLDKSNAETVKYRDLLGISTECSNLRRTEIFHVIEPFVGVPEGSVDLNGNVSTGNKEINTSGISTSNAIPDAVLMNEFDIDTAKYIGDYILDFGYPVESSISDFFCSNIRLLSSGALTMPICSISLSRFDDPSCNNSSSLWRDGINDIIGLSDDSWCESISSSLVLTGRRAESVLMLNLFAIDNTVQSGKFSATISANDSSSIFGSQHITPKLVRTNSTASSLSSMLEPFHVCFVALSANGTRSLYCLHLYLPKGLIKSLHKTIKNASGFMGREWDKAVPSIDIWKECLRVLKPGAFAFIMCAPRQDCLEQMYSYIRTAGFKTNFTSIYWHYATGFPKAMNIGLRAEKMEREAWINIGKMIDNLDKQCILNVWKENLKNAKSVEILSEKNQTEIGTNTLKKDSVQEHATVLINQSSDLKHINAIIAELNLEDATHTPMQNTISTVLRNADQNTERLLNHANDAVKLQQNQFLRYKDTSIVPLNATTFLCEKIKGNLRVEEVLKILRGNKQYSSDQIINVLCAELTEISKLTILNQSKTFQNLDTTSQTEIASATNVIITESTAENLILYMVNTLVKSAAKKAKQCESEVVATVTMPDMRGGALMRNVVPEFKKERASMEYQIKAPASDLGKQYRNAYAGYQPKPALEVIIVAMKPLEEKNYIEQALKTGKGITYLGNCRIPHDEEVIETVRITPKSDGTKMGLFAENTRLASPNPSGRFAANVLISDESLETHEHFSLDRWAQDAGVEEQRRKRVFVCSPLRGIGTDLNDMIDNRNRAIQYSKYVMQCGHIPITPHVYFTTMLDDDDPVERAIGIEMGLDLLRTCDELWVFGDRISQGMQREIDLWHELNMESDPVFLNIPKVAQSERDLGCEHLEPKFSPTIGDGIGLSPMNAERGGRKKNIHPTVKPLKLFAYLITLGSRPKDVIMDPFCGSGTACLAAKQLNRRYIGIELDKDYYEIAKLRVGVPVQPTLFDIIPDV